MKLEIRSHGFSLTQAIIQHVQKRFASALRHGGRTVADVTVRLRDVNGPRRGGVDKRCGVEIRLAHGGPTVIQETDDDLYTAIDRAANRSKRTLLKKIGRLRKRSRVRSRARTGNEGQ